MHEQSLSSTGTRRLTTRRVPSFVKQTMPALTLVLAFVLPPLLVGAVGGAREWRAQPIERPPPWAGRCPIGRPTTRLSERP